MNPTEGGFASINPRATLLGGSSMHRAGPDGLAVGRFGWADTNTALATNARTAAHQTLGFVLPVANGRQSIRGYLRPGVGVTLMAGGDFWARFAAGARAGTPVYARIVDGAAISGEAGGAELTPWFVVNDTGPGGLAIISTTCKVTTT